MKADSAVKRGHSRDPTSTSFSLFFPARPVFFSLIQHIEQRKTNVHVPQLPSPGPRCGSPPIGTQAPTTAGLAGSGNRGRRKYEGDALCERSWVRCFPGSFWAVVGRIAMIERTCRLADASLHPCLCRRVVSLVTCSCLLVACPHGPTHVSPARGSCRNRRFVVMPE